MSDQTTYDDSYRNRVRVGHLVVGLVFLGLALSWALRAGGVIGDPETGVVLPAVLVAAGVVGLAVSVLAGRRRRQPAPLDDTYAYNDIDDTKEIDR